jgi:hypothetical protein
MKQSDNSCIRELTMLHHLQMLLSVELHERVFMYDEWEGAVIAVYFKVLSWHLLLRTR